MICFSFFKKNSSLKKKFFFKGLKVREDWLVLVNLFYKESRSKTKKKNIFSSFFFSFFFFFLGGGGGIEKGGGGLSK